MLQVVSMPRDTIVKKMLKCPSFSKKLEEEFMQQHTEVIKHYPPFSDDPQ